MLKLLLGYIREISGTWLPKKGACLAVCVWKKIYEYVDNISNGQVEEMDIFFFFLSEEQINILNELFFSFQQNYLVFRIAWNSSLERVYVEKKQKKAVLSRNRWSLLIKKFDSLKEFC